MEFGVIERMQVNQAVERVLHVPGSYAGSNLEMAFVFDMSLPRDVAAAAAKGVCDSLKAHSKTFWNVRLNAIRWQSDDNIIKEISAMPLMQMGRYFEDYECSPCKKRIELLTIQLKKFYARSKVIIFFTDGNYRVEDQKFLSESLQPFLYRRLILAECREESGNDKGMGQTANMQSNRSFVLKTGHTLLKQQETTMREEG